MPYQATAMRPRITAGMLAPSTPNVARQMTGYGTPLRWLDFAIKFANTLTMPMPTSSAINTCQLVSPSAKRLPAKT